MAASRFQITERCSGCGLCLEACVVDAIDDEHGLPFVIVTARCVACAECARVCPLAAVHVEQVDSGP